MWVCWTALHLCRYVPHWVCVELTLRFTVVECRCQQAVARAVISVGSRRSVVSIGLAVLEGIACLHYLIRSPHPRPYAPLSILPLTLAQSVGSLSTLDGKIVDENGTEVTLKGFALSGFESSFTISGDPLSGSNSIAHDWRTNMYR